MILAFLRSTSLLQRLFAAACLGIALALSATAAKAGEKVDPNASPNDFVLAAATNALEAVKSDEQAKAGNLARINELVDQYILPYVDFEKTTRLAAGRYWRQATPQQQHDLVDAFRGTLVRTYSGALANVDKVSGIKMEPFRGDPNAKDVAVRSTLTQTNGPAVAIGYRLEKTPEGWKIYDLNVENIWLIQNYRNQFAQQISQNGIDGLIAALKRDATK
ncbi:ABC transporter substrate-binding protein [Allopusillimonas soli]|uniref:ABC transporter substrate-binding protein n=1 Tax=Allopusillimonas soli TaxID=659016 RepID=A0A853FE64_9BURK|nr:ABC transporter substrate-binding protein [Allopusillimonas soli]NYT37998.1 ABC transporter substrate-binding protein [Allopusillimonas soli]TEA73893.1 ABC transporter substrate-binding protein [Allopusillimonas soli]